MYFREISQIISINRPLSTTGTHTRHKDRHRSSMCQKCLAAAAGFRSNDQLIIYRVSTFPGSYATTPDSQHWERAQFQDNPSCITLMSSGLHLRTRQGSSILTVVVRRAVFGTRIYACTTNRIVRVHESVLQTVEDTYRILSTTYYGH